MHEHEKPGLISPAAGQLGADKSYRVVNNECTACFKSIGEGDGSYGFQTTEHSLLVQTADSIFLRLHPAGVGVSRAPVRPVR